jgi:hypothetical protein
MSQTMLGWVHVACAVIATGIAGFLTFVEWHAFLKTDYGQPRRTNDEMAIGVVLTLALWAVFYGAVWL